MTKISTYVVDEKVTALDKWIGSDANMQNRTKNFTPKKLAAYFNEDQVINIGTPLQYKYYTLDPLEARPNGTLTFETEIGPTVNFSSITTFLLSKYTTKQNIVSDFLNFLDGSKVLLFKSSDINSFGFYRILGLEPYEADPNFFVVTVDYETGNGALEEDEDYMISLVSLAGDFIPTKTSELINDGDDGVNPFISELDIDRTEWDAAYEGKINSAEVTGDTTKTLTLTKQDGSTIEASWTDDNTDAVTSVFGRNGDVVAENGDYNTDQVTEENNLYFTEGRSRSSVSLTTTGSNGEATYDSVTGVFNIPNYSEDLVDYVPYTGATKDVNLGIHQLKADSLAVSITSAEAVDIGGIVWNPIDGTFDMGLIGGVTLQAGQELHMYGKATEAISNGQAVMFAGVQGDHILIAKADSATINVNPEYFIGIATQNFTTNDFGYVTVFGNVRGLNTTAYTLGSVLYYNSESSTDGLLTATEPTAPNAKIIVAAVVRVHANQGILLVRPHVMPKLKDIQDVYAPSPSDKNGLFWNNDNSRYENNSISGILGYTPANDNAVVHIEGVETVNGIKTFGNSTKFDYGVYLKQDGVTASFPGYTTIDGTTNGYVVTNGDGRTAFFNLANVTSLGYTYPSTSGTFALTSDLHSPVTIGTANGLSLSGQQLSLGLASSTLNGALSSTDWNTFNNKQAAGNYITSLTGEVTASGPGAASATLNNASVTGKILSGVNITGGTILDTDTMLTAFGKLQNQINSLIGGSIYQGVWNANTNTPTLTSSVGVDGNYYIVNVAGSTNLNGITDWKVGDWAIFHGGTWQKVDNTDAVSSVNGFTGAVSLTTDNIAEGVTNQYFLNSRARAALSFAAGSGAYNSTIGVITIPTNNNQITNGSNFITLSSLSGSAPIQYNNTTGAISITQAGTSSNGFLSSTDWNTFNSKQNALTNPVTGTGGVNEIAFFSSTGSAITSTSSVKIVGPELQTTLLKVTTFGAGMVYSDSSGSTGTLTGTTNALTYWSSPGTIGSLSTATYPNLTELSYVKGVTSSIQSQLNSKVSSQWVTSGSNIYYNTGNVGIGTTSPATKLEVTSGSAASTEIQRWSYNTGNANFSLRLKQDVSDGLVKHIFDVVNNGTTYSNNLVLTNGNVGIGTTSPSGKLDVIGGEIRCGNGTIIGGLSYSSRVEMGAISNHSLGLITNYTTRMLIDTSGNVGIGTTSPAVNLHIKGSGSYSGIRVDNTGTTGGGYVALYQNGSQIGLFGVSGAVIGSTASDFAIFSETGKNIDFMTDGTTAPKMRINTSGNVGIGTTSPLSRLHIEGDNSSTTDETVLTLRGNGENGKRIDFRNAFGSLARITGTKLGGASSSDEGILTFETAINSVLSEKMRITSGGNVGIGTTSPSVGIGTTSSGTLLDIYDGTAIGNNGGALVLSALGNSSRKLNLGQIRTILTDGTVSSEKGDMAFSTMTGSTLSERMRITSGGSVVVNNLGTGLVYSNAGALTSTNPSDERLKDEITDLQYGLNEILQLRPVSYNWKNDTINQGKQFGFIAQEVKEVMPELISEFTTIEDEEEVVRLGLDKEGIYATLVNAIKELKSEIELLKQK